MADAAARIASTSSGSSRGPGSFTFVTVPSGSTRLTFTRVAPFTGTTVIGTASARSPRYTVAESAASGSTAVVSMPSVASASETLRPLPAASDAAARARIILPRSSRSIWIVRSMLGFGVTVTITVARVWVSRGDAQRARPRPGSSMCRRRREPRPARDLRPRDRRCRSAGDSPAAERSRSCPRTVPP